jgi:hypothetical protein
MRAFTALYALSISFSALAAPVRRAASANTITALRKFAVLTALLSRKRLKWAII